MLLSFIKSQYARILFLHWKIQLPGQDVGHAARPAPSQTDSQLE